MIKSCAAVALACVAAATAGAVTAPVAGAEAAPPSPGAAVAPSAAKAEAAARAALAPLEVERALCIRQSRRRVLCLLAHPDAGDRSCRSAVLVRPGRVRVVQSIVCFEFREVTP